MKGRCTIGILEFILWASLIGFVAWLVTTYIPMPTLIKTIIIGAAVVVVLLLLADATGLLDKDKQIPRVN